MTLEVLKPVCLIRSFSEGLCFVGRSLTHLTYVGLRTGAIDVPFFGFGVLGVFQFQEIFDWLTYITRCVDLRTGAFDVPPQEILTRDSVTVSVDAVVYYQVYLGTLHSHQGLSYHLIYIYWVSEVPPPLVVQRSLFLSVHLIISTMKYENMFLSSLFF